MDSVKLERLYPYKKTHPLKITVNHSLGMDVEQPPSNASQLNKTPIVNELEEMIARL